MSERLGHAGITITSDLYEHVLPSIERAVALQIRALFVPPSVPEPSSHSALLEHEESAG